MGVVELFRFSQDQSVVNIAGVKVGGQPGENPTVLCGTIFYHGHRIVEDANKGLFDHMQAEHLINQQAVQSEETGNPAILHLYAESITAFEKYFNFVEDKWDGPFIADSADSNVRSKMAKLASEVGSADRIIYNSIGMAIGNAEEAALMDADVDSAIILAFNPANSSVEGHIKMLEEGDAGMNIGLIPLAKKLGITNHLIDPGVVPIGNGAGLALRISVVAKARFGIPVGSGMHNAVSSWEWLRGKRDIRRCCDAAATALQQISAGDFILYGPIENAEIAFPVAAMTDILIAEAVLDLDIRPADGHPLNRLV
jgi:tetrahydromethanopterin S-methyltransferase subunit H